MSVRKPGQESLTIEDLPRLISEVAAVAPERVALSHGDTAVTYGTLHDELTGLDAAMGGALGPDALVPVVLSNLVPALLESDADGGLAGVVETLICDTGDVVDVPVVAKAADTLPALFEQQVARTPDAIALEFEGETLTYAQFDAAANRMARYLVSIGVGPETTVGLAIRRSLDLLVAMYGIVKAGGAYVPLDPDHPADRIAHVLAAARPVAVLTTSRDGIEVPAHVPLHEVDRLDLTGFDAAPLTDADRTGPLRRDNTAYIIFTSGSTGLPKGVAVAHRAIVANLRWRQREYGFTEADVILQKTPFTFDVSVWEFFWPLQVGARLVVAVPDGHRDPEYLARAIADRGVTALHFVPSMLSVFVAEPLAARTDSLRYVFASGEALPAQTVARFHEISSAELHNLYGPTEAAVDVTYYATARGDRTIPIGAAVADTGLHVLDDALRPVPPGVPGELYLSGVQLARGYVARPDLTSDRFVADPTGRNGERMYRTGDLVRRRPDGQLDYIGRVDFQVKLRGLRVELGEIEAAILGRDDVSQAVVVVHSDPVTGDHLVAYVVATGGVTLDTAELTATARERLPDYMVPNLFVQLDEFPLNASGKLDRKALPAPDFTSAREYREPSTPAEQAVAQIFADLLGAERVGADDDFFELGGNSLIATRAVARINSRFSVHVEVGEFFDAPTVADLARLVDEAADRGTGPRLPLRPMPRPDRVPLSLAQQRMWFLNQLEPDSAVNNIPFALRLSGLLDRHALQIAVADVLARHEVLRTVYPEVDGVGYQKVVPTREVIPDLSPVAVSESEVAERIAEKMAAPFDVTQRVPFWAGLFEISATEHVLAFSVHHIAGDGFSMGPLTRDVMTAYAARSAGESPDWQPLTVQYADYSIWQREMLGSEDDPESVAARQIDFWKRELADLPDELPLPTDRPRPAVATSHGDLLRFSVDASLRNRLNAVARDNNATLFMVVHSALAVLLSRLSGSRDIAIGSPVAGRGDVALDDLIGMFVNPLVLRSTVDPAEHFTELLSRVRASDLKAFAHAEVPFERLVEVLNPVRSQSRHPLFQVALAFQNMDNTRLELPGLTVSGVEFDYDLAKFDLQVTVADHPDGADNGLLVEMSYATDLFDPATVESIVARFVRVLEAIAADPAAVVGDIELLDAAERDALVAGVDATRHDIDASTTLPALFEARAADNPGAVAVVSGGQSLTYGEFASRVNRLARRLIAQGVGPEVRVALAMRRSADLVMAMYAVLTAGGAYVPVDPDQPDDRIDYILDTAAPLCVLVADAADAERFGDRTVLVAGDDDPAVSDAPVADADRRSVLRPDNTAYVLFTSGSTGRPKGVSVAQRSVVNQVLWLTDRFGIDSSDVVLLKTPVTFDVSVWELFCTLLAGARMVIAEPDGHRDPVYLAQLIDEQSVTMVSFVPSMLGPFVSVLGSEGGAPLRAVLVAGEAFPPSTAAQVHAAIPGAALHNLYGPTEFTVHATEAAVRPDAAVTIGRSVWNSGALVLDSRLRPVPFGVAGELYLSGVQLARGYHGRVDLTADRFVADPYGAPGERMYRTGDLVRWTRTAGGAPELVYIGRTDFQVKFRGQRIELGEIEAVLSADPSVLSAVVLVHESSTGQHLVAYVVPVPGAVIDAGAARTAAAAALPSYMVPSVVTVLDAFPLNASGKLDRKALPEPEFEAREFRAPTTPVEEIVAGVFGEVLGVERVGLDDDFFALGGNSLIATQVVSRLGAALDTRVQVRTLFEASTVVDLAARLESHVGAGGRAALTAQVRPERVPLSLAQSRMWFLNRFDPDSTAYNLPMALRIRGALDVDALRAAVADVVARHESLRTVYPETSDGPVQVVLPVQQSVPDVDVERTTAEQLLAAVTDFMVRPFDVTSEVPLRIRLFDLGGDEFVLAMVVHHISADGASMAPFVRDVMLAYSARVGGGAPSWVPPAVQYADYALWQRSVLGSEDDPSSLISQQIRHWTAALAGLPDQLELPADRPRPAVQSVAGARVDVAVPAELHGRLVQLARAHNATLFMVVHAALSVLLARLSGTSDVAVGTPIAGRGERELDDLIGMFVNTLVLRADVRSGGSFEELLGAVRESDLQAFAHADVPFERLVEVLNPARSTARHPLFQVGFSFQNLNEASLELDDLAIAPLDLEHRTSQFDLHWIVQDTYDEAGAPTGIGGFVTYATALFDESTVVSFVGRFVRVLEEIVADPSRPVGDLEILGAGERSRILESFNDTAHEVDASATLVSLFEAQVAANPDAVAVQAEGIALTYREFDTRVNLLARQLIAAGVRAESTVALGMRRSVDLVIGMVAVAKAGGAYVPVDPDQPAERTDYILGTVDPVCVLTTHRDDFGVGGRPVLFVDDAATADLSAAPITDEERIVPLRPDHTAYVIFTSGSTGRPKGVAVPHRAVANQLVWKVAAFGLGPGDAVLLKTAATFDLSVWEFWSALVSGGRLVVAEAEGHRDPAYLLGLMRSASVSTLHVVPSMLEALLTAASSSGSGGVLASSLRRVLAIGEALPGSVAQRLRSVNPGVGLFNLYGPTEAAVSVTWHEVSDADVVGVPIGVPEWNVSAFVLDERLRPVPVGVAGELYLSGVQLARGYFGRPELTADRFVANPFAGGASGAAGDVTAGARMYRTGDLVRWLPDCTLDYLGRTDFQVKVRGFRIELGEIESVLRNQVSVSQAVVVVHSDRHTGEQLVGYVVPADGAAVEVSALAAGVAAELPSYMVPTAWVVLDALPLNINGKIDRKALPAPQVVQREFRAPTTPVEEAVAAVFAEVLGVERVGLDDDFFALGGNSLVATQVTARLGAALDAQVPVRTVFEASTVAALAAAVESHAGSGARAALTARPRPERVPLSLAQQRMWFLNRFDSGTAVNNIPVALRLSGALDVAALTAAVSDVVARHEVLRTYYPEFDGVGQQVVLPVADAPVLGVERVDAERVTERVAELIGSGFDVTAEVPFRAVLLELSPGELSPNERILVLVAHHISADGFSMGPLARDVMVAYAARSRGEAPSWAPLEVQYADFALWQREVLGDENDPESLISNQLAYWSETLAGTPDVLDLPTDRPRPAQATYRGDTHRFELPADVFAAVERCASEQSATPFMVVHAAFAVLLARLSGTEDIVIGSPVAGRGEAALDDLVGMFVNTAVLRTVVDGSESFTDLLRRVREGDLAAFGHADVPFERLVDELDPVRSQAHSPIFQVVLAFQNLAAGTFELGDLSVAPVEADAHIAKFDLQLTVVPGDRDEGAAVPAMFEYATDLFDDSTVAAFAERFVRLLAALTGAPDQSVGDADLFAPGELAGLLAHAGPAGPEPRTLPELIAAAVAANPDGVAVRCEDRELTYRELDARSSQLARVLLQRGVGAEQLVAVAIPRSIESVLAVWAVTKTGAAFVPVDANYPADRIEHMVTDARAAVGLTLAQHVEALPGVTDWLVLDDAAVQTSGEAEAATPVAEAELPLPIRVEQVAYVIYTSGSTGKPKGVSVTHAGLHNFCVEQRERYRPGPDSRILHVSSPSFDASMLELLLVLGASSTMVISPAAVFGGAELAELIRRERVSHAFITPAVLASMDPSGLDSLQHLAAGGEAVPADVVARWAPGRSLYNGYGPTETTIMANISEPMVPGAPITIGGPIRGMREVVLDARLRPVPVGVVGELYISGVQLARGYHARGALTADRFVADPYGEPGERMYRTGDVVRWTPSGEIAYVGRSDHQVKIRGLRVELDEIDAVLVSHERVDFAATIGHETPTGGTAVVSYVVPAAGADLDTDALREFAATSLPAHMVPVVVIPLDAIPLTPVGKLDRRALPEPLFETKAFRAPSTPIEEIVAGVFADVLGVDRVGADDDFFDLGGNSLIATQVAARLGAALDTTVPVRELFEAPTVGTLAARLEGLAGGGGRAPLTAGPRPEIVPLSLAQQRMWFLNRFDPASGSYNIPLAIRLSGTLDVAALQGAVGDVIGRHEILRTVYPELDGSGHQVVLPVADALPDLTPERVGADELPDRVRALASAGFDVTEAIPVRIRLFAVDETEHVLVLVMHHISGDGFSLGPLTRDVMVAYTERAAGRLPEWAPLPVQYADFALWQRAVLGTEDDPDSQISAQLGYWREALAGLADDLELPTDRPRPAMPSMAGAYHAFTLEPELHRGLTELARAHNTSMFMVVHAALAVLLARLTGGRDIAVGTGVAGRGEPELDDLIGMFVNTLVLRTDVDPSWSFGELVDRARETDLSAFANADLPFERLVEVLDPARSSGRHPFFQVMLSLQNFRPVSFELPGLTISGLDTGEVAAKFDLMLTLEGTYDGAGDPDELIAGFTYATDLFDGATVERFAERFTRIVEAVVTKPDVTVGDIDIMGAAERAQFQARTTDTESESGATARNLVSVLMSTVESDPEAPALADGEDEVSYAELDARSSRSARFLLGRGIGTGSRVGIRMPRSMDRAAAVWAVLKTGAAVVLLDEAVSDEAVSGGAVSGGAVSGGAGLDVVLGVAGDPADASVIVLDDPDTAAAIEAQSGTPVTYADLIRPIRGDDPAFVLAAGTERERVIGHAAAADVAARLATRTGVDYESRTHVHGPADSEAAVLELLVAAIAGAALVAPQERAASFEDELADQWVTHLFVGSPGAPRFDDGIPEDLGAMVFVDVQPEPGYEDLLGADGPDLFTDVVTAADGDR